MPLQRPTLPSALGATQDEIIDAILKSLAYTKPDPKIQVAATLAVGASTAGGVNLEPPANQDLEFDMLMVTAQDVLNIDAADFVILNYLDVITNQNIQLARGRLNQFAGNLFAWPSNTGDPRISYLSDRSPLTKRKNNQEPWLRFVAQLNTTATVGTRNFQVIYCYLPRQTLNP